MNSTMRQRKIKKKVLSMIPHEFLPVSPPISPLSWLQPALGKAQFPENTLLIFPHVWEGSKNVIMIFNSEIVLINKPSIQLSEATCQHSFPVFGSKCGNKHLVCSELCK